MHMVERYRGAMLGLAVGDAVGTTLEFQAPGTFTPISDMVGGGPFALQPGEWTDDTSMALCLAESLTTCQGFNAHDQAQRYVAWMDRGTWSVKGYCFDIGATVRAALTTFKQTEDPYAGSTDPATAGNGSIMRLAPVPLAFAADPRAAIEQAGASSRITHGAAVAVDACRYLAALLVGALRDEQKATLLAPRYSPVPGSWDERPLCPEIDAIANGSFRQQPPVIKGSGYVVKSLEAALWAFATTSSYRDCVLAAANLGDDADTTAAVAGQLAGAFYGVPGIPAAWLARLAMRNTIVKLADDLYALAQHLGAAQPHPENSPPVPIAAAYWVVPGRLLASEYPGAPTPELTCQKLRKFLDVGVTFFVDLTFEGESGLLPYAEVLYEEAASRGLAVAHRRMSIRDLDIPTADHMHHILQTIDAALADGQVVCVHCWGGVGRTGTVVGCYFVRHGMSGDAALAAVRERFQQTPKRHRMSPETSEQQRMVRGWDRHEQRDI